MSCHEQDDECIHCYRCRRVFTVEEAQTTPWEARWICDDCENYLGRAR